MVRFSLAICTAAILTLLLVGKLPAQQSPVFHLSFDSAIRDKPFTGRVYLFFSRSNPDPRTGPNWFSPDPFLAKDVTNWQPNSPLPISLNDPDALIFKGEHFPRSFAGHHVQAVARFDPWQREIGTGPGNGYSQTITIEETTQPLQLSIDSLVQERPFAETRWGKLFQVPSKQLTSFHDREVSLRATVRLPASYYDHPSRRYPVIYTIPGFGGDHRKIGPNRYLDPVQNPTPETNPEGIEFIRVLLDPNCPLGHHVFADSANNGPVGAAFTQEFIPALDQEFRTIPHPTARFVAGHSSGGWSSLWLQITYPRLFGGVWSTAPDPVDFQDFQNINIYEPNTSMWVDSQGNLRPLAQQNGQPIVWYRDFDMMEQVLGPGGQLHSFDAVFSPRHENGQPAPLWDRKTGLIDPTIAQEWRKYDIRHILETNWPTLSPHLAGKLHVFMGDADTFYLAGATRNLKKSLAKLESDAHIEIFPGRDHSNLLSRQLREQIDSEIAKTFREHHPNWPAQSAPQPTKPAAANP